MNPEARRDVRVLPDLDAAAAEAAALFVKSANQAVAKQGMFRVALSGGNTPRSLYETLASDHLADVDWDRVQIFFSDERFVPPDSVESNYRMAHEALLSRVPIPERFVHRFATEEITPEESAALYDENVRRVFEVGPAEIPRFDLILLGLGPDGHTASLFPGTAALQVGDRIVVANFIPKLETWRLTFTYPLINAPQLVLFLVAGQDKSDAISKILSGVSDLPAARVQPADGELVWILDEAAAGRAWRTREGAGSETQPGGTRR